jgi:hypothetical protein
MSEHPALPPESVSDMVGRRALELLAFEGEERLARYELVKDQLFWTAVGEGMPRADAYDMSEKVSQWALDLVARITATGGAAGGRA